MTDVPGAVFGPHSKRGRHRDHRVGNIFEGDHVNTIVAAGRADLCAIARPHLADPAWTLHEAAKQQFSEIDWPVQYVSGKTQLERNLARAALLRMQA